MRKTLLLLALGLLLDTASAAERDTRQLVKLPQMMQILLF